MDYELCDPADNLTVVLPTAGKRLSYQLAVDNDACVGASLIGEILRYEPLLAQLNTPPLIITSDIPGLSAGSLEGHTFSARI